MVLELKLNTKEQTLLLEALHTRLQRVKQLIEIFEREGTTDAKITATQYSKDYLEIESMLRNIQTAVFS